MHPRQVACLTVVSVGSHELAYQHEAFLLAQDVHLTGRFMIHELRFDRIQSPEELGFVLDAYDERPDESGCSFKPVFLSNGICARLSSGRACRAAMAVVPTPGR